MNQRCVGGVVVDAQSPAAICFDGSNVFSGPMRLQHYVDSAAKHDSTSKIEWRCAP